MMRTRLMQGVLGFTALTLLVGSFKVMQSKPEAAASDDGRRQPGRGAGQRERHGQRDRVGPAGARLPRRRPARRTSTSRKAQRVVAGQPLGRIDDQPARAKVEQAQADVRAAQDRVRQLLEGSTPQEQEQNNANIDAARTSVTKAGDTVRRAEETLRTGTATRQNAVDDARRNLDNARSAAAQHAKDLQLDIDQIAERLARARGQAGPRPGQVRLRLPAGRERPGGRDRDPAGGSTPSGPSWPTSRTASGRRTATPRRAPRPAPGPAARPRAPPPAPPGPPRRRRRRRKPPAP